MNTPTLRFYCFNTPSLFSLSFRPTTVNSVKSADLVVGPTHSWHPHSNNNPSLPTKLLFYPSIPSPSSSSSASSKEPSPSSSSDSRPNFTLAPPISAAFSPFTALGVAGPRWFEENWPWSITGAGGRCEMRELEVVRLGDCVELVRLAPVSLTQIRFGFPAETEFEQTRSRFVFQRWRKEKGKKSHQK